ncbi:MAG TPA: sugar phosphate nucleotidyltransferase [Candidatus Hydrogenedentes bacterium]|nr:sugar phosphate nucleotidyltransferase [Candidatus Hydrogenedentota bacterium]HOT50051.1 sugar phosphate nucleotidyltransferase [Candidatus Hydrogenedentota bacterium]HOV73173.1 sugar phosphate nucleotidyltransferase [Candidatus Hydrogenedentota bacterium]HPC16795.1 sugar phosphate nucleotidyltransferase [Candidatus Hydrogenedentota bacterium]HRT18514.1 sugar phosphate nucleotidyltransferase [Candidatus Hydrogenedentota bacterium]
MKGVVLAGGMGTRLRPLTRVTNKHLLPVYDKPMVFYPIQTLVEAGITEIMLVTGGNNAGDFLRLIGNGEEFGLKHMNYAYQKTEGGIADALRLARHFVGDDKVAVILGDNFVQGSVRKAVQDFMKQPRGAKIFLKEVSNPQDFGVAVLEGEKVVRVIEKPPVPPSNLAVIGIYLYDASVFEICETLVPSDRGELEITDVNNEYIRRGVMTYEVIEGWWADCGSFEALLRSNILVARERGVDV